MKDAVLAHRTGRSLAVQTEWTESSHVLVGMDAGNYRGADAETCGSREEVVRMEGQRLRGQELPASPPGSDSGIPQSHTVSQAPQLGPTPPSITG